MCIRDSHQPVEPVSVLPDGAHLPDGFDARFDQQLKLIEPVAFFVIALNVQLSDRFDRRRQAFMPGQQNDIPVSYTHLDVYKRQE